MPIKRIYRWLYPIDWPELSRTIRFKRARGACECCGRPHGQWVFHLADGRWWDPESRAWRTGQGRTLKRTQMVNLQSVRRTRVFLACAHLNHDPAENSPNNLRALCQRCHLLHDRPEHLRRRRATYRRRLALGDLFEGPYPELFR
jgi:hypothetical protein